MSFSVARVADRECDAAFSVLRAAAAWLQNQGRQQRISQTSRETYRQWQAEKVNYAVRRGREIAGVFSLPLEQFDDWPAWSTVGVTSWLRALATHPDYRRQQVGCFAVEAAIELVAPGQPLYLDCVAGFLPTYYESLGFQTIDHQRRTYPDGKTYDIVLLRHAPSDGISDGLVKPR